MPRTAKIACAALALIMAAAGPPTVLAQGGVGKAVVLTDDGEYTVLIECDQDRPEHGFRTRPNRVTREATGQNNPINVRLRDWQDTDTVVLSVDGEAVRKLRPTTSGRLDKLEREMSPHEARQGDACSGVRSVDRHVACLPRPTARAPLLELELEMSPNGDQQGGMPVVMTHERWTAGERFPGTRTVRLRVTCGGGEGTVPGFRKLPTE